MWRSADLIGVQVRLVERDPVDIHQPVIADLDHVAGLADHALDEWRVRVAPLYGWLEDDDVTPVVGVEPRRQLVDEDVLALLQRPLHRLLLDLVGLCDEVLDDEEDQERQDERLDELEETPERRSLTHKSGSIGAAGHARRWSPAGVVDGSGTAGCGCITSPVG